MTRECHVRFCERLRGKLLRPTHHFGMKLHIGVDSKTGLAHSAVVTAANVHDKHRPPDLPAWEREARLGATALMRASAS